MYFPIVLATENTPSETFALPSIIVLKGIKAVLNLKIIQDEFSPSRFLVLRLSYVVFF